MQEASILSTSAMFTTIDIVSSTGLVMEPTRPSGLSGISLLSESLSQSLVYLPRILAVVPTDSCNIFKL